MTQKLSPLNKILLLLKRNILQQDTPKINKSKRVEPLKAELFSTDQMEQQGKVLAATHKVAMGKTPDRLLKRLAENEKVLKEIYNLLVGIARENGHITPAGEWLLDNFYLIEEQVVIGKKHFPKGYSRGLPCLIGGSSAGLPRVYDIAMEVIAHSDGRADLHTLNVFVAAYQTVTPLELGELWAIPIMLRLALLENLSWLSSRMIQDNADKKLATMWAEKMIKTAETAPNDMVLLIADMARSVPPMTSPFVAELSRNLQGKDPSLALTLTWMDQQLFNTGSSSNELIYQENQKQATDQVFVSYCIGSLRFLSTTDWRNFVESLSTVEQILKEDNADVYTAMDFSTRDQYRHIVEKIAKKYSFPEPEIAQTAINLAKAAGEKNKEPDRTAHVGYYLLDKGREQVLKALDIRLSFGENIRQMLSRCPLIWYSAAIILCILLVTAGMSYQAYRFGVSNGLLMAIAICSFIASGHLAIMLVNWASTLIVKPKRLPGMDFSKGIPYAYRTMVAIPSMLTSARDIEVMTEALEVRFLANTDENLHFALLTDFPDAGRENMPGDDTLLKQAISGIEALNKKYKRKDSCIFFLLHRARTWNKVEKVWMGYERKRGKLAALNSLLQDGFHEQFAMVTGDLKALRDIRFVLTLDADTSLPRDAAWKMVAVMAHPLNQAVYAPQKKRVVAGYGILQPRIGLDPFGAVRTRYMNMHGSHAGMDPYTQVVSDVYQDIFGEGSFVGKGIYDVAIFEQALQDAFPENRILSHDLLEGCYIRSGLVSHIQLQESYPADYQSDSKRRHRWVRGDWQIASWVLPFVPGANRKLQRNPLSALSRWKILDNIRRSLSPLSLLGILLLGWIVLPGSWFWTLAATCILILPLLLNDILNFFRKSKDQNMPQHLQETGSSIKSNFYRILWVIASLPQDAWYTGHAIVLANWRMIISRRGLLEWTPSGSQSSGATKQISSAFTALWAGPVIGVVTCCYLAFNSPLSLLVAIPVLLLWIASPAISWWIGRPVQPAKDKLSAKQYLYLHQLARKIWSFFNQFVTEGDNWLPPDNYQEQPVEALAHRTSPTNIGLALLANLSAYDFGYISHSRLLSRTGKTLQTMQKLERYRGHFYNWYDTQILQPLFPRYISAVDSGNLAGHLLTLQQGVLDIAGQPILHQRVFKGLYTVVLMMESFSDDRHSSASFRALHQILDEVYARFPETCTHARQILKEIARLADELIHEATADPDSDFVFWKIQFQEQVRDALQDLERLSPWSKGQGIPAQYAALTTIDHTAQALTTFSSSCLALLHLIDNDSATILNEDEKERLQIFREQVFAAANEADRRQSQAALLVSQCETFADEMDYAFLYDNTKHLLRIGYNVEEQRPDPGYYDLLASEARLGNFVAIAQGKLPQESWFALGRLLVNTGRNPILLSWSGSMFEYLMPLLVMPSYENTLMNETNISVVKKQIAYGQQKGVPWGISESGYNQTDAAMNYQYRAFGIPRLGLKRGLADDLVIAPYASMLALMIAPEEACSNLQQLSTLGFEGRYGLYEAIDYTPARLPRGETCAVVSSFMIHHQGMGLLSIAGLLLGKRMQKRFETVPQFRATLLLLQERVPRATIMRVQSATEIADTHSRVSEPEMRLIHTAVTPFPEVQVLSNGNYQVMVNSSGGGYSRWKDIAVTRWREDIAEDNYGVFCYIKELDTGVCWSNTHQPLKLASPHYGAVFSQGLAEFHRIDNGLETRTEIVVSPEDDIELRRVRITNRTQTDKTVSITSFAEVVLTPQAADESHPAFSNLFVQTEIVRGEPAIICTRRARSLEEMPPWLLHLMHVQGVQVEDISFETDRMQFTGRGNAVSAPRAMQGDHALSNTQGAVLDPVVAIRYRVIIKPEQTATVDMILGVGETRAVCSNMLEKYHDRHLRNRAFGLSWTHNQVLLRQINATEADVQLYDRLAGSVIYINPFLRGDRDSIENNRRGQSGLWSHSVSGDLPIVLLHVSDPLYMELARQMVQAHAYWRLKGLFTELVIWNEDQGVYRQVLQEQLLSLISATGLADKPGGIFIRSTNQISPEDRILFQAVARIVLYDHEGSLAEQISRQAGTAKALPPKLVPLTTYRKEIEEEVPFPMQELSFFNGIGGFSQDGRAYHIRTGNGVQTPAPWVNVIANPDFGTVISERGNAYTWSDNAHEFRLTPWHNDPVSDTGGEAFYLRDEESGHFWSPVPMPAGDNHHCITKHGFGYSIFEQVVDGIFSAMQVYVDTKAQIKFTVLKIKNQSGRERVLTATGYVAWVLGEACTKNRMHIVTRQDKDAGTLFTVNGYNSDFPDKVCFFDTDGDTLSFTTDRTEFIGRGGSLRSPAAMSRIKLSGRSGCTSDPCTALMVPFELYEGQEKEIIFRLGAADSIDAARVLAIQFKGREAAHKALQQVHDYWRETLGKVQINTPVLSLNMLANGWLTYQTLASRILARSGYYQSGGAYGFRDQLQDVLSLLYIKPDIAKEQILRSASRQFREGDVQHWWHPPSGKGVRTRCSDDYLWLPFVTAQYVSATGDNDILFQPITFLEDRLLQSWEETHYSLPGISHKRETLYHHCVTAIRYALRFGSHGLPLIGSGDWNDGMDKVGIEGRGESVWLAFFLYDVLKQFSSVAVLYGDPGFAAVCDKEAETLQDNIERYAWDGEWYRRAYFDDGTPLGSKESGECRIDSISQSWAVLSGAGDQTRARQAMQSVDTYLVKREAALIQLLDPPFDKGKMNPGYIKGYVPGVRENGGQYTHAAIWTLMAFARLGDRNKAWELFSLINPLHHAASPEQVEVYKTEPYVVAADVYGVAPHTGRGGWTWYTGAAGWMYQFIWHDLLGFRIVGNRMEIHPCIPADWPSFEVRYQYGDTIYHIRVRQSGTTGASIIRLNGSIVSESYLTLSDDGQEHTVYVDMK